MDCAAPSVARPAPLRPPLPGWRRRAAPVLGTLVELSARCAGDAAFERICTAVFERLRQFHRAMSFHEADSDVRAIARAPAGTCLQVTADTWAVMHTALALETESQGCFNVAIAPSLVQRGRLPSPESAFDAEGLARSACAALQLETDHTVHVRQRVWIDLGGIAKGAAVDAALAAARDAGALAAIVNAGGDLALFGDEDEAIEVVGPNRQRVHVGRLGDGAVATSGPFGASAAGALVVPSGDAAAWADRSVTVIAPRCLVADALTKVVAARGSAAAALLARHGAHALGIDAQGRVHTLGAAR